MTVPLYRAEISPAGPLASPLHSDTLFGAFCWSWLRQYGQDLLETEIIMPSLKGEPPVIFSNGFPHGGLPLPLGCYDMDDRFDRLEDKTERQAAYQRAKRLKGARYISREAFGRIRRGDWRGFTAALMAEPGDEQTTLHNMVSRYSGTVENIGGAGNLFSSVRRFFCPGQSFDLYVLSSLPRERLTGTLELMLALGIGADKSSGCGVFHLASLVPEEELMAPPTGANGFVALSNFIPAAGDPTDGRYQTLAKYPKLDRELEGGDMPFKKPMLFLKAGSLFRAEPPRPWYGRCVTGVAAVPQPVTANGCTIAAPVVIPETAL